jgi:hypothetical protein
MKIKSAPPHKNTFEAAHNIISDGLKNSVHKKYQAYSIGRIKSTARQQKLPVPSLKNN